MGGERLGHSRQTEVGQICSELLIYVRGVPERMMAINIQVQGWLVFESGRIGMVGPLFAVCRGVRTARYSFTVVPVARVVAMRAGDPHRGTVPLPWASTSPDSGQSPYQK